MNAFLIRARRIAFVAIPLACSVNAFAFPGPESTDIDATSRARMAKEKARASAQESTFAAQQRKAEEQQRLFVDPSNCAGQGFGNFNTGAQAGAAPRTDFGFAPNPFNFVGSGACR